jgi:hypothetical protein
VLYLFHEAFEVGFYLESSQTGTTPAFIILRDSASKMYHHLSYIRSAGALAIEL